MTTLDNAASSANLFASLQGTAAEAAAPVVVAPAVDPELDPPAPTELDLLKNRARLMGMTFSNNIGLESLRAKVKAKAKLEGDIEPTEEQPEVTNTNMSAGIGYEAPVVRLTPEQRAAKEREAMIAEQMKLVRLRITNLNPTKKDLPGEIITFANRVLGSVRKFIPFGEQTENGYHVPFCLYTILKEREFVSITSRKGSKGQTIVEHKMAREFALEVLDPLTSLEINRLAAAQAAAAGGND